MNSLALCTENLTTNDTIKFEGVNVHLDFVNTSDPEFDYKSVDFAKKVLVKKLAFSCNYRDRSDVLRLSEKISRSNLSNSGKGSYSFFGSEFVAEIIEKGSDVEDFNIGDRIVVDGSYPFRDRADSPPGLPTNKASSYYQVFGESQLLSIPKSIPIEVAASISIGAQTVYSIIRRLDIKPGSNILITSAGSSTSMFAIAALKMIDCKIFCLTTSNSILDKFADFRIEEICLTNFTNESFRTVLGDLCSRFGGIDYIIDPFCDLHFFNLIDYMNFNSKYIFCGIYTQHELFGGASLPQNFQKSVFAKMIIKNISLIGNCLGSRLDLLNAINDYQRGNLDIVVDSVHDFRSTSAFFEKSFISKDRFGKVIFKY